MNAGFNIFHLVQTKPIFYIFLIIIAAINILILMFLGCSTYYLIHIGNHYVSNSKELKMKRKYFFYFFVFVIILLLGMMLYHFRCSLWKLFAPVIWAIIFAYLLNPIVHLIDERGVPRIWSVIIVYATIIIIMILVVTIITPNITKEARNLIEILPKYTKEANEYLNHIYKKIEELDNFSPQLSFVKDSIQDHLLGIEIYAMDIMKQVTNSIFNIFSQVVTLVLIPIFTFYFLKDADYFKKKIVFIIPRIVRKELINICKDIHILLNKFIRGQFIVATCVGILSIIALLMIKVNFAFLIGIIAGISNIIPYFGPIIGAVPGVVIALLDTPMKALWVIIAFTIIQQIESAIITPKIVGESVGLHPVTVIIALLIGNEWLGLIGLIFAVPIAASIKIITKHMIDLIVNI
ncbi:AI-2E family transporter [Crassaminicella profunda]|uniref:AI-2E family transporter n=1 Tax=Crassaminicella profunda TaxID=1286698 RepID=UPI001CA67812|nr:AI-2E family transporter [Crassaminicella profunda]QZY57010.1 AI-2E family transporter [Crassaminicella profunda]